MEVEVAVLWLLLPIDPKLVPELLDIAEVAALMEEINELEAKLVGMGDDVSTESIAIKNEINRKVRNPSVKALLERLEIKGEPVWGFLSRRGKT